MAGPPERRRQISAFTLLSRRTATLRSPMDWSIVHALNSFLAHHDAVEDPVAAYMRASEVLFLAMLVVAFFAVPGPARRGVQRAVVAAGLSAGLALAIGKVLSTLVDRTRPFVAHPGGVHLFAAHAADAGFPSDHASAAFAIAVALLLRDRRWGLATLALATVLAVGRAAIGVHYPSDVLAGAVLGSTVALLLHVRAVRVPIDRLADRAGALIDARRPPVPSGRAPAP